MEIPYSFFKSSNLSLYSTNNEWFIHWLGCPLLPTVSLDLFVTSIVFQSLSPHCSFDSLLHLLLDHNSPPASASTVTYRHSRIQSQWSHNLNQNGHRQALEAGRWSVWTWMAVHNGLCWYVSSARLVKEKVKGKKTITYQVRWWPGNATALMYTSWH